jgi:CRP/FNR family transcriptional regulator, cyclic AMP receptor protein
VLDGGSRTATAAEASSLYVLDREDMLQLFKKRPEAGLDMLGAMGRMTRKPNALLQARVSRNVNEAAESKLSLLDRIADVIAAFSGSMAFLILNGVWFVVWIAMNVVPMPWPFDPFPFGLPTMIVSLEAIFLSCFVLISQARQSAKDGMRAAHPRQGGRRARAMPTGDAPSLLDGAVASGYDVPIGRSRNIG